MLSVLLRRAGRHTRVWACAISVTTAALALGTIGAAPARADSYYSGMLAPGVTTLTSNTHNEHSGYVYGQRAWNSPVNESFHGFDYTAGSFQALNYENSGGIYAGLGGDGSANNPVFAFPETADCGITNNGHDWVNSFYNNPYGSFAGDGNTFCTTTGNTNWDITHYGPGGMEIDEDNIGLGNNLDNNYGRLWLTLFCQTELCAGADVAHASVTNLSAQIDDPDNIPANTLHYWTNANSDGWDQTDYASPVLAFNAVDASGVCFLNVDANGPTNVWSPDLVGAPATTNPGGQIREEFLDGTSTPCDARENYAWTLPAGIPDGTYGTRIFAANAGNYQQDRFSGANTPQVGTGPSINVDDTTPVLRWLHPPGGWSANTSEQLSVSVGPSGLRSLGCRDNGAAVNPTLVSGSIAGAGTTVWSVPTGTVGADAVSCTAVNGDVNGGLSGSTPGQTFNVDDVTPTVSFSDPGYVVGEWTAGNQTVAVRATAGPSGVNTVSCLIDGVGARLASDGSVVISGDGQHTLSCTATSNDGEQGAAAYHVWIDARQPTLAFQVNGSPPNTGWLNREPIVQVLGSESGGLLSGLAQVVCTVTNGGKPVPGSPVTLNTDNGRLIDDTGSFTLTTDGVNLISCGATTVAGVTQAVPGQLTVRLDDPDLSAAGTDTTRFASSELIDAGADPYSDGPSETTWYRTAQAVTITADNTGGSAGISAISCKGALTGTWPRGGLNTDPAGGEQITLSVPAPGGSLDCGASDTAGNSYPLGSYLFQVDSTAPTGGFVPQSDWAAPNEVSLRATDDGGSGIAYVHLYARCPCFDAGAAQDLGDMAYNPVSGDYQALVPDGVAPFTAGTWTFFANDADLAGNQGQITAGPGGGVEQLALPLLQQTTLTASVARTQALADAAIPVGLAYDAQIDTASPDVSGMAGTATTARAPRSLPRRQAAALRLAGARRRRGMSRGSHKPRRHKAGSHAGRRRRPGAKPQPALPGVLRVRFGQAVTLRGTLTDTRLAGDPVAGATLLIYQLVQGAGGYQQIGAVHTDLQGRYSFRVAPGASRALVIMYPGSRLLRPAATQLQESFRGSVSVAASRIIAGRHLVISGAVRGGHIPHGGVTVTIRYRQLGAPGSGTLGSVRTNASGHYRFRQHFSKATRGLAYRLWAVVRARQPGWPFRGARSVRLRRRVS